MLLQKIIFLVFLPIFLIAEEKVEQQLINTPACQCKEIPINANLITSGFVSRETLEEILKCVGKWQINYSTFDKPCKPGSNCVGFSAAVAAAMLASGINVSLVGVHCEVPKGAHRLSVVRLGWDETGKFCFAIIESTYEEGPKIVDIICIDRDEPLSAATEYYRKIGNKFCSAYFWNQVFQVDPNFNPIPSPVCSIKEENGKLVYCCPVEPVSVSNNISYCPKEEGGKQCGSFQFTTQQITCPPRTCSCYGIKDENYTLEKIKVTSPWTGSVFCPAGGRVASCEKACKDHFLKTNTKFVSCDSDAICTTHPKKEKEGRKPFIFCPPSPFDIETKTPEEPPAETYDFDKIRE